MRFILSLSLMVLVTGLSAAEKPLNFTGSFVWNKPDPTNTLTLVLTPKASESKDILEWEAVFTAQWKGKPMTFSGTAKGEPAKTLAGNVTMGKRSWRFDGTVTDGAFAGKSWETTKKEVATGTVTWKVAAESPTSATQAKTK